MQKLNISAIYKSNQNNTNFRSESSFIYNLYKKEIKSSHQENLENNI